MRRLAALKFTFSPPYFPTKSSKDILSLINIFKGLITIPDNVLISLLSFISTFSRFNVSYDDQIFIPINGVKHSIIT